VGKKSQANCGGNVNYGLLVDIRNVSYRDAQFNASLEPFIAFGSVPIPDGRRLAKQPFVGA
jgi:hypothetical protein